MTISEWSQKTLDDVCLVITDGAHLSPKSVDKGLPMASVKDLHPHGINLDTCRHISEEDFDKLIRQGCQPEVGDVLIAKDGASALDTVCEVKSPIEVVLLSSVAILRPDPDEVLPSFLRYYLDAEPTRRYMKNAFTTGAAIPRVVLKDFKRVRIKFPPLPTQRKIAGILSAYDDLIENNLRRIKILEQMAQAVYREWFVNFRFPGHEKVKMTDSELGPIPQGWEVKKLGDVVSEIIDYRGKTPKKLGEEWSEKGVIALSALNVKQGKLVNLEKAKYVDEGLYQKWMKSELQKEDILMTSEAPLGQLYYLAKGERYCLSQRLFAIRANPRVIAPVILYYELSSPLIQEQIHARASGSTVLGIRQARLRTVPVRVPTLEQQNILAPFLKQYLLKIDLLYQKNANLRRTRDLLLPRLISGKLDVSDLDINMGEVA